MSPAQGRSGHFPSTAGWTQTQAEPAVPASVVMWVGSEQQIVPELHGGMQLLMPEPLLPHPRSTTATASTTARIARVYALRRTRSR